MCNPGSHGSKGRSMHLIYSKIYLMFHEPGVKAFLMEDMKAIEHTADPT
jgi:hypothetical protein